MNFCALQVFNKTNNKNKNIPNYYSQKKEASRDKMGFPTDFDNSGPNDVRNYLNDQQNRKDLEDLLSRADEKNVCKCRLFYYFFFTFFSLSNHLFIQTYTDCLWHL